MKHEARNTRHEARILVMAMMAACSSVALAMPTQQELKKVQPMVAELMAPTMDDFKAKKKTAAEVADMAIKYAGEAETEAAKFMLYRSSVPYYVRGEAYDKAADAVELMKANVKDVPAFVIEEIISKATVRATAKKAPRLFELYRQAKAQSVAEKDIVAFRAKLKKNPGSLPTQRNLAEALATSGDWDAALKEFAKLKDGAAQIAKKELDGNAKSAELGEFWWSYKPTYENADDTFEMHAAVHYRKALAAGEITGLKKNIVEQRIAKYAAMAVVASGNGTGVSPRTPAATGLYCVIDLSGGPDAKKYPVTYVDEEPSGGWTLEEKTKKIVLRKVKAGDDPLGRYTISKDYYIGVFEVSQEQWERVMGNNPSENKCEHYPVTMISTVDVRGVQGGNKIGKDGFAAALSERTGIGGFDLPTEAQWDYANRVGAVSKINDRIWERCRDNGSSLLGADPLGDTSGRAVANCKWEKNEQKVAHAGSNLTNPLGDRGFRLCLPLAGGAATSAPVATTPSTGSIELKTGGASPFTVKGNEATLELGGKYGKLEFVKCPAGTVKMMLNTEGKTKRVKISRPFWITKTPILQDNAFVSPAVPVHNQGNYACLSRKEADNAISAINDEYGESLPKGMVVRLATLAELEYAYHANTHDRNDPYYDALHCHAYDDVGAKIHKPPRGKTVSNAWGLYDFGSGLCLDKFDPVSVIPFGAKEEELVKAGKLNFWARGLPDIENDEDPLYWTDAQNAGNVSRNFMWARWFLCDEGCRACVGGVRLVIGPDLVSEWKAKNGKK